ncbi:MAG: helicase-related protein, partial [Rhodothermales bacterium]|nr:helicase-related protein [Rhodothermales bacterium]
GIIYAATRREADEWAEWLSRQGTTAEAYHAGLPRSDRDGRQSRWMSGETRVIVATSAFGMGIDKPDVRFVVHVEVPGSLEAYYQEAGRAGRDGKKSYAALLFNDGDESVQQALIQRSFPSERLVRTVYDTACSMAGIPIGSSGDGRFLADEEEVARSGKVDRAAARAAFELMERLGVTCAVTAGGADGDLRVFDPSALKARADREGRTGASRVALWIVRDDRFMEHARRVPVRLEPLSDETGLSTDEIERAFEHLASSGVLEWRPLAGTRYLLNDSRVAKLGIDKRGLNRNRRASVRRLQEMIRFANTRSCRRQYILAYFGEVPPGRCGRCDRCIESSRPAGRPNPARNAGAVIDLIRSGLPRSEWDRPSTLDEAVLGDCLDWLIREGYVRPSNRMDGSFELTDSGSRFRP